MGNETFELERFVWATPDRLEIDGRFVGLDAAPPANPVLVLQGDDRTHRLAAVTDGLVEGDGGHWHAAFAWQEAPTAFGTAQLELGDELFVELPEPRWDADPSALGVVEVRRRGGGNGGGNGGGGGSGGGGGGGDRLRLQGDLLAVRSELAEARARVERVEKELARAREDLDEERTGRAADAEQLRAALAEAQTAAEETISAALAEEAALRAHVAELSGAGQEAERLRARLTSIRDILDEDAPERSDVRVDPASA
jgi:hypothetical protein